MTGETGTPDRLWPIERRILGYLDQRGPTHRQSLVPDLAAEESRIGRGIENGSNAGIPRIMGAWCRRLVRAGLVVERRDSEGYYRSHEITELGSAVLRRSHDENYGPLGHGQPEVAPDFDPAWY